MNKKLFTLFFALILVYCCSQLYARNAFQVDTLKTEQILRKLQADSNSGDTKAQYELGRRYERGDGLEEDEEMALYWYKKAAEGGSIPAAERLSSIYSKATSKVVTLDYVEAEKWCRIAADAGNPSAQNRMGWLYDCGYGGLEKSYTEAMRWYKLAAENGSTTAIANVGNMYLYGRGVEKDYTIARQWIEKAVNLGNTFACLRMGNIYEYGYGVDSDPVEAFKWYMKGAEKDDCDCQHAVAYCLRYGKGCEKNTTDAVKWYTKAIDNGREDDWYSLGGLLYDQKLYTEAVQCFEEAYLRKYSGAATFLGYCFENGHGVNKDYSKAMQLYKEDAEAGYADGYYYMGRLYEQGHFIPVSSVKEAKEAIKFIKECYEKGIKAGSKKAENRLKVFESKGFTICFQDKKGRKVTYSKGPQGVGLYYGL